MTEQTQPRVYERHGSGEGEVWRNPAWHGWRMSDADAMEPDCSAYLYAYTVQAVRWLLNDLGFSYLSGHDTNIPEERQPAWLARVRDEYTKYRQPGEPDWYDKQGDFFACFRLFGSVGYCREAVFIVPYDDAGIPREARLAEMEFFIRSVGRSARMAPKCVLKLLMFEHSCVGEGEADELRGAAFSVDNVKPMSCGLWGVRPKRGGGK